MKKLISFLLCICLLGGISIAAYATNVDEINPSGHVVIAGITGQEVPVHGTLPTYNHGSTIVVIAPGPNQEIFVTENGVEGRDTVAVDEKTEEDATPATKEEVDEEVEIMEGTLGEQLFALTNKERENEGLKALKYNKDLQEAADIRAKECAENFSHTRPDGSSCHTIVADMDYKVTGENLVKADSPIATAKTLMGAWMDSEGHRANILLKDYTSIAIGTYEKDDVTYAVQIFLG